MEGWVDGVWTLLPFMATLSVMLMAGDAIAKSPALMMTDVSLIPASWPAELREVIPLVETIG
ncbi:hypothetical protein SVXHr_1444 [Halorhabdus sp. SVX81]|uniref:TIGR00366 family protein n=1 Tax=Halorhabdus sp. SVX81 TaxID=2978283 RepID=UPI0023DBA67C|nr:TIGR00366 family protein [Halorhabdus sp. SVX81]WEL17612.1 hypothetical protein SVXHr_1444 [Halorhabdus sp. SVX81]